MSSHKRDHDGSVISPGSTSERAAPSDQLIEYQDLHRTGPIADRAFAKYEARGYQHGHDVEDWLASEREVEQQQRERVHDKTIEQPVAPRAPPRYDDVVTAGLDPARSTSVGAACRRSSSTNEPRSK